MLCANMSCYKSVLLPQKLLNGLSDGVLCARLLAPEQAASHLLFFLRCYVLCATELANC